MSSDLYRQRHLNTRTPIQGAATPSIFVCLFVLKSPPAIIRPAKSMRYFAAANSAAANSNMPCLSDKASLHCSVPSPSHQLARPVGKPERYITGLPVADNSTTTICPQQFQPWPTPTACSNSISQQPPSDTAMSISSPLHCIFLARFGCSKVATSYAGTICCPPYCASMKNAAPQ